jgi:hypothetical protein
MKNEINNENDDIKYLIKNLSYENFIKAKNDSCLSDLLFKTYNYFLQSPEDIIYEKLNKKSIEYYIYEINNHINNLYKLPWIFCDLNDYLNNSFNDFYKSGYESLKILINYLQDNYGNNNLKMVIENIDYLKNTLNYLTDEKIDDAIEYMCINVWGKMGIIDLVNTVVCWYKLGETYVS